MKLTSDVVICGAGIAGLSAAYYLAVKEGITDVLLVDERPPLSLTSDKSTECYRNWWPGPGAAMVALTNRSIDLMEQLAEESNNIFHLNRRGYLYLSADPQGAEKLLAAAREPPKLGAGPLRIYRRQADDPIYQPAPVEGFHNQPDGADLFLDADLIQQRFPYVSDQVVAALHVRRAGWFSAQQLGMYLLSQARQQGVRLLPGKVASLVVHKNRLTSVLLADGSRLHTRIFINAAGPFIKNIGSMMGVDLPVYSELHQKVAFRDVQGALPREAPMLIWHDPQYLPWSQEEKDFLAGDDETRWLLGRFPPGAHTRPEGSADSDIILMLWEYRTKELEPVFPPPLDPQYPDIVLRGLAAMVPALSAYFERALRPALDGGYYTKTRENRPLIGPLPVAGAYLIGALSGFGLMAACAAGELLAAHVAGAELPPYAPAFMLERYHDPAYQRLLENWDTSGQL